MMTESTTIQDTAQPKRLLLIEDSPVQAREISIFLNVSGFDVVIAEDGESGLSKLATCDFDLILCDLHLPGMNGFDVCRQVKTGSSTRRIPVILLTRWADPLNVLRGLEVGADGFVSKGQRPSEIIERVRRVINRAHTAPSPDSDPAQVVFLNTEFRLTAKREQLLEVLLAGFEDTVYLNEQFESEMKERLKAESASREKDARLHALFQSAVDGILTVDRHGHLQSFNPSAETTFGYRAEEVVGKHVSQLLPSTFVRRPLSGQSTIVGQICAIQGRRKGGDVFPVEVSVNEIKTTDGTLFTAFVRDITARHQAEQALQNLASELQRSNGELEQFAYVISHDLKEPLRMVNSFTKLLDETLQSQLTDDARRFMSYVLDGAERMRRMIDDLLSYSRVGKADAEMRQVDLNELLDEVLQNLAFAIDEARSASSYRWLAHDLVCAVAGHAVVPKLDQQRHQIPR